MISVACPHCGQHQQGDTLPDQDGVHIAICQSCGAALCYVGWVVIPPEMKATMVPEMQQMISEEQDAVRRRGARN